MFRLRPLVPLLLLLSAVRAEDEIKVERTDDAVIVRSPIAQANFLVRLPAYFEQADELEEPFAADLAGKRDGVSVRIRLRLGQVTAGQARRGMDALVREKESDYAADGYDKLHVSGEGGRRLASSQGKGNTRMVLVVVDGPRLYELFMDVKPSNETLEAELRSMADGFTILDPKGAPIETPGSAEQAAAETITHDYYRLKVYKPAGFLQREVDPERDAGIFLHLRKEDELKNRCDIRIRVHLARAMKQSPEEKAEKAIERFVNKYQSAKAPKKPKRTRFAGAKNAWKFKMAGKVPKNSSVVEEEWRVYEHENGRIYEFQLTTYGAASREFRKDIAQFWRKTKISSK